MLSRILFIALAVELLACTTTPTPPVRVGGARAVVSPEEFERRIQGIQTLVREGRDEEAVERVQSSLKDWPPESIRRRLNRIAYEIRRDRFYRDHPLHLSLTLDDERYAFGGRVGVKLRIRNLGRERLTLPARFRTFTDALLFRPVEQSILFLKVVSHDSDGVRLGWASSRLVDVPIEEDLVLPPGGTAVVDASVDLDEGRGSMVRRMSLSAIFRPIAIIGEDGERRYDPLEFPSASARVFHTEHAQWTDGGIDLLETCVAGEGASERALFAAAVGLTRDDLRDGLDLLVRTAPSLDPQRSRAALRATEFLTGKSFSGDPIRALAWWEETGAHIAPDDLARTAGLLAVDGGGTVLAGAGL